MQKLMMLSTCKEKRNEMSFFTIIYMRAINGIMTYWEGGTMYMIAWFGEHGALGSRVGEASSPWPLRIIAKHMAISKFFGQVLAIDRTIKSWDLWF